MWNHDFEYSSKNSIEIVNVLGCVFIGLAMSQENLDRTKIVKFGMFEKN